MVSSILLCKLQTTDGRILSTLLDYWYWLASFPVHRRKQPGNFCEFKLYMDVAVPLAHSSSENQISTHDSHNHSSCREQSWRQLFYNRSQAQIHIAWAKPLLCGMPIALQSNYQISTQQWWNRPDWGHFNAWNNSFRNCHVMTFWNLFGTANFLAAVVWTCRSFQAISHVAWKQGLLLVHPPAPMPLKYAHCL